MTRLEMLAKSCMSRFASLAGNGRRFDLSAKITAGILLLIIWEVLVSNFAPPYVASPIGIARVFPSVVGGTHFQTAVWQTFAAIAEGLVIALLTGVVTGLAMGRVKLFDRMAGVYVNGLYSMPMVAILPLITLWFGYTSAARLATIVFAAFFSIAINTADGARSVPREYLEVAKVYHASRWHVWFTITLPASMPYLLAGIRLALGRAVVGAVIAEFFASIGGLGFYILTETRSYHHNQAIVAVIVLALFGVLVETLMKRVTKRLMPWHGKDR